MCRLCLAAALAWQTISPQAAEHARAGIEAQKQGHLNDAISEFRMAAELAPELPAAFANLGAAYLQSHQYQKAIEPLKHALTLNPDLVGVHQMLGIALLSQGSAAEAIPHLERAGVTGALGVAQLKAGKLFEAVTNLQTALNKTPGDPDLLYYLGRAAGLLSKSAYDALESGHPSSPRAHQALAENYAALKQTAEAERELNEALRERPDTPGIHLELGQLYINAASWNKAADQLREESKLQPADAEVAYDLGQALLQQGKLQESRSELDRSDSLRPGMPETLYLLGKVCSVLGDSSAAEKAWKQLLVQENSGPLAAQTHFGLAALYRKNGRAADAARETEAFRKAQSSGTVLKK